MGPTPPSTPRAIVSIHDVEPGTLPQVLRIVDMLESREVRPVTLLVVPGMDWSARELDELRRLTERGYSLAGHGWVHQARPPATLHHRLHGWILSRDKAEHLSRSRAELRELVDRCHRWFGEHDFPDPVLYVPPAWAQGALRNRDLRDLPFRLYENLLGYVDRETGRLHRAPVVGYEADTRWRRFALRRVNALSMGASRMQRRPLRISIHPHDLDLFLAEDLERHLGRRWTFVDELQALGLGSSAS